MHEWEVYVGNVGTVYHGGDEQHARKTYQDYVHVSDTRVGRAGGETVVLFRDGEILKEHVGKNERD